MQASQARERASWLHGNPRLWWSHALWALGQRRTGALGGSQGLHFPAITVIKAAFSSPHYAVFTTLPEKTKASPACPSPLLRQGCPISVPVPSAESKSLPETALGQGGHLCSPWSPVRVCVELPSSKANSEGFFGGTRRLYPQEAQKGDEKRRETCWVCGEHLILSNGSTNPATQVLLTHFTEEKPEALWSKARGRVNCVRF